MREDGTDGKFTAMSYRESDHVVPLLSMGGVLYLDGKIFVVVSTYTKAFALNPDGTRSPADDFHINSAGHSIGMTKSGKRIYVGEIGFSGPRLKIFAYDIKTKARLPSETISLNNPAGGTLFPRGIAFHGNKLWVLYHTRHDGTQNIYTAYAVNLDGTRSPTDDFELDLQGMPHGFTYQGNRFFIVHTGSVDTYRETTPKITEKITARYSLLNYFAEKLTARYSLLNYFTEKITIKYSLLNYFTEKLTSRYSLLSRYLTEKLTARYSLLSYFIEKLTIKYSLLNYFIEKLTIKYSLLGYFTEKLTARYSLLNYFTEKITARYSLLSYFIEKIAARYSLLSRYLTEKLTVRYSMYDHATRPEDLEKSIFLRLYDRKRPITLKAME